MNIIEIYKTAGDFAENKDIAREIRVNILMPALLKNELVTIDFSKVSLSTQSFIHALISDAIRKHGLNVLDLINFKGCNKAIKALISTVCDYMQDTGHEDDKGKNTPTTKLPDQHKDPKTTLRPRRASNSTVRLKRGHLKGS